MKFREGKIVHFICALSMTLLTATAGAFGGQYPRTPDGAMKMLQEGNERFVSDMSTHPNTGSARFLQAGTENQGDHAYATVITCSDSRVPVERVFDAGVMDIFVIRVAGNVCDTDEVGSIEYGLAHVNTPVLVVLGHTQCGAVTAVTHAVQGRGHPLERNIPPLVDNIQPAVQRAMQANPHLTGDDVIPPAIVENVWQGIDDLFMTSPSTRNLVNSGQVKVVGAIYDVSNGQVRWLPESKTHQILARVESNPSRAMNVMAGGGHGAQASHGGSHSSAPTSHGGGQSSHSSPGAASHGSGHSQPSTGHGSSSAGHSSPSAGHGSSQSSGHGSAAPHANGSARTSRAAIHAQTVTIIDHSKFEQHGGKTSHGSGDQSFMAALTMDTGGNSSLLWILLVAGVVLIGIVLYVAKSGILANIKTGPKLYASHGSLVALAMGLGLAGFFFLGSVTNKAHFVQQIDDVKFIGEELGRSQDEFMLHGIENRQLGEELLTKHEHFAEEMDARLVHPRVRSGCSSNGGRQQIG